MLYEPGFGRDRSFLERNSKAPRLGDLKSIVGANKHADEFVMFSDSNAKLERKSKKARCERSLCIFCESAA
jgi:hypothetical protein